MELKRVKFIDPSVEQDHSEVNIEKLKIIQNNNLDAHMALVSETQENDWEPELSLEPIIAWEVTTYIRRQGDSNGMIKKAASSLTPILASGLFDPYGEGAKPYAIFYKSSGQWYIPNQESGIGKESCLEYLVKREKKIEELLKLEEVTVEL